MDRWSSIVAAAAAVTVAAGAFAVARAVATDDPLPPPPTVAAVTTMAAVPSTSIPGAATTPPGATSGDTSAAEAVEIEISGFSFSPAEITVARGTTVTWVNRDGVDHSIISEDGSVLSPPMGDGDTFSFTFTAAGVYPYICGFHPEMAGTIVVEG